MKKAQKIIATAAVVAGFVMFLNSTYSSAQDQKIPTKQEMVTLLKSAKEPSEHLRIAAYYKQESSRLSNEAELHRAWANIYGKGLGLAHCTNLANLDAQGAKEADALAAFHEKMANAVEKKQP